MIAITDRVIDAALRAGGFVVATLAVCAGTSCAGVSEGLESDPLISPLRTPAQRDALLRPPPTCNPQILSVAKNNIRALHDAGVTVLAGTDVGNAGVAREASLLSEPELLTGSPWFVKVPDRTSKPQCGPTAPSALEEGFQNAVATALTLRDDAGLGFVAAPERSRNEESVVNLDER